MNTELTVPAAICPVELLNVSVPGRLGDILKDFVPLPPEAVTGVNGIVVMNGLILTVEVVDTADNCVAYTFNVKLELVVSFVSSTVTTYVAVDDSAVGNPETSPCELKVKPVGNVGETPYE